MLKLVGTYGALATLALMGCTRPGTSVVGAHRPTPQIVHVISPSGRLGAGFPISCYAVLTCAHVCDDTLVADVEGSPMGVVRWTQRELTPNADLFLQGRLPSIDDWVALGATAPRFHPDRMDPDYRPEPGGRVIVAGFHAKNVKRCDFPSLPATYVEARVVPAAEQPRDPEARGLVWVAVPAADYGGFSGGPAAVSDDLGQLRVWGSVAQSRDLRDEHGTRVAVLLGIAPIAQHDRVPLQDALTVTPQVVGWPVPLVYGWSLEARLAVSERTRASACPVDVRTVLVAGSQLRGGVLAATVNGLPMAAVGDAARLKRVCQSDDTPYVDDWVLLSAGRELDLLPNSIEPDARPSAGAAVVVAGFPPATSQDMSPGCHTPRPTLVAGTLLPDALDTARGTGAALVSVPQGDYAGFLGGPVATQGPDDRRYHVWGLIVDWQFGPFGPDADQSRLIVAPLARDRLREEPRDVPRIMYEARPREARSAESPPH